MATGSTCISSIANGTNSTVNTTIAITSPPASSSLLVSFLLLPLLLAMILTLIVPTFAFASFIINASSYFRRHA